MLTEASYNTSCDIEISTRCVVYCYAIIYGQRNKCCNEEVSANCRVRLGEATLRSSSGVSKREMFLANNVLGLPFEFSYYCSFLALFPCGTCSFLLAQVGAPNEPCQEQQR